MNSFEYLIQKNVNEMRSARINYCKTRKKASQHQREQFDTWRSSDIAYKLIDDQLKKLGYICPVCQKNLYKKSATIDHLASLSKNYHKAMDEDNFLVMCFPCNQAKYDTPFHEWREQLPCSQLLTLDYAIRLIHGNAKLEELMKSN